MGLGLRVGDQSVASWSYSGFGTFRRKIASQIGVNLSDMEGFGGSISWDFVDDPIKYLLHHSDCDGILEPEICLVVANRLEQIIKDWPDTFEVTNDNPSILAMGYPPVMVLDEYDKQQAKGLIDGMRVSAVTGQPLIFC